jgi:hypothetical protein
VAVKATFREELREARAQQKAVEDEQARIAAERQARRNSKRR